MKDVRYLTALLLTALSGSAALAHELLWTRRLIDLLGASSESGARVFSCFFLGLALGAAYSTSLVPRLSRAWRAIGWVELSIVVLTLPALSLPIWTGWVWPWLGPERMVYAGSWVKLAMAVVVVTPPAFAMGMTLPFMAVAVLTGSHRLGRQGVWLYAINTVGGVFGLLMITILALHQLGVAGSMVLAMGLNLLVAVGCFALDRWEQASCSLPDNAPTKPEPNAAESNTSESNAIEAPSDVPSAHSKKHFLMMLFLAFASGAGVLATEVLGLHLFGQVAPSAMHAMAAVLAAVILLLAVASFMTPFITTKWGSAQKLLPTVLSITGLAVASAPILFMWITGGMKTIPPSTSITLFVLKMTGYVLVAMGPCLLISGLVLPLVFSWLSSEGGDPYGKRWGWLLAVNGFGGIIGAEIAQHGLMPIGMHAGLGLIGLTYAALGAVLVLAHVGWPAFSGLIWRPMGMMLIIVALNYGWLLRLPLIHPNPTEEIKFKTLDARGGPEGVVAVTESETLGRGIVMFNQYVLGSTAAISDERRQAHLPIMLHPDPKNVAFVGLATGITAGAALAHDNVESVTAIELSQLVADASRKHFSDVNGNIFDDPRGQVVVEDGRTYLAACASRFDVIMSELFLPWRPGVGRLYSIEHFRAAHQALKPGGLFCQMLPMYQFNREQHDVVLATLLQVFPKVHLFRLRFKLDSPVLAIVAFRDVELDWTGLPKRCEYVRQANVTRDPLIRHAKAIAMLYMGAMTSDQIANSPINTLGNAWVELHASLDFITGKWSKTYFLKESQWLAFEDEILPRLTIESSPGLNLTGLSQLGHQICRWDFACRHQGADASELGYQVYNGLPSSIRADLDADHSSWEGWPVLLNRR